MKWLARIAFGIRFAAAIPLGIALIIAYPFIPTGFRWLKNWVMDPLEE
jgi:hypothetical protein